MSFFAFVAYAWHSVRDQQRDVTVSTEKPKHTWQAIVIAVCTAIAGVAGVVSAHYKSFSVENKRVSADEALLDRVHSLEDDVDWLVSENRRLTYELDDHYLEYEALVGEVTQTNMAPAWPDNARYDDARSVRTSSRKEGVHGREQKSLEKIIHQRAY